MSGSTTNKIELSDGIEKGSHFICDGGYHSRPQLIVPYKHQLDDSTEGPWSDNLESARKDVECFFGIPKKRCMILKNPMQLATQQKAN